MAQKKRKYYTVWVGLSPGVYDSWTECQLQINGVPGAKFKSFDTREEAVESYRVDPSENLDLMKATLR